MIRGIIMPFRDLRQYIEALQREGEVQRIAKEVDWNLEVGAVIRRSYDLRAPAPLFEKLKDYPEGYRILGAPAGLSSRLNRTYARVAISMDMAPDAGIQDIIEEYIKRKKNPIKPVMVSGGPCKENIQVGDDVDLYKFPVPFIHDGDGGRYIGTWHVVITKDPESDWVNYGMYRLMLHDRNTMGGILGQHAGLHYYQKYEPMGKEMEFAVAIGTEPVTPLIGGNFLHAGISEADVIGGIRGEPLELVRCETVHLSVPASSEIVIEGVIMPHERREEGPFGEYPGYRAGPRLPRPVYHVKAITYRNDPILTVSNPGVPVYDGHVIMILFRAAEVLDDLRTRGFPVKMVSCPPCGVNHFMVVSTRVPYPNYATHLANAVWSTPFGRNLSYLVIVDDDVDASNLQEVIWAITTRCHPDRGIFKVPKAPGHPLIPFLSPYEKRHNIGAQVLLDCTWPKDWPKEAIPVKASFDVLWPEEIQRKVLESWKEYGYAE